MISTYAPQVGRTDVEKRIFWDSLNELVRECAADQRLIIGGDLNRHIGATAEGYAGVHGGFCYGVRNDEGCSILEFATSHNLVVVNSFFRKRDVHLITFQRGSHNTQIDCLLVRRDDLRACGDLNRHIGATAEGYAGVHGGFCYGVRNDEGCSILEFATAHNLVVANSFFRKRDVHLITFQSGGHNTQIDYLLVRRDDLRACKDCKVFSGETCSSQHKLVALDALFQRCRHGREATGMPRILWKNLSGDTMESFRAKVSEGLSARAEDLTTRDAD
ncbi:hypothetical protein CTI12_AA256380 [Artemisia annua]|uniref:Craniofacial development protein 2 n=1 Tax=Artemisia annua TaxID=35608 RepID=A0A2U1NKC3_ARTAN|nr:hypothetical protein CTI12_AA256380 [Artemisia annua]